MRRLVIILPILAGLSAAGQKPEPAPAFPTVRIKHYRFSTVHRDAQMWSAMYIASNGKIYTGLCTHGDAANVYEFDPRTETMRHLADITVLAGERGKGIWTNGKIHVQMQELDGYVYFGSLSEDNGPPAIDAASYLGPRWFRIHMNSGKVEPVGFINSFWGLLGQAMDPKRRLIYGLAEDGRLYKYHIDSDYTEDLGRVDNWDICRTIFIDDLGNVYGSFPPGQIWKYDPVQDRIFDFEHIRLPLINQSRTMANPMLDRKVQWRIIEWDPLEKAAYGIIGGSNLLFRYTPHDGPEGKLTPLVPMCAPPFRTGDPMRIPYATLAMTISQKERKIYYLPVAGTDFDYGAVSGERRSYSYLITYDLKTGERKDLGVPRALDGRFAYGMGGAKADRDGRIWFVGAFEEPDAKLAAGRFQRQFAYSMGLGVYDPFK